MLPIDVLAEKYATNKPFPHIVIDDAFDLSDIKEIEEEVVRFEGWEGEKNRTVSNRKRRCANVAILPPATQRLILYLNSADFLPSLEQLTGIKGLIPDPYLDGGGIHSVGAEGFLKIHADFNWHPKLNLYRRLNLLLYLNSDWQKTWGGALELWDADMTSCRVSIPPLINRMVIFNTSDTSFHGHPDPLMCPESRRRNSIALYYYTALEPAEGLRRGKTTQTDYRPRLQDSDPSAT